MERGGKEIGGEEEGKRLMNGSSGKAAAGCTQSKVHGCSVKTPQIFEKPWSQARQYQPQTVSNVHPSESNHDRSSTCAHS